MPATSSRKNHSRSPSMMTHHHIMKNYHQYLQTGPDRVSPFVALASFPDACASQVSIELGVKGPSFSIATACSSASDAIGYAWDAIRSNVVDFIIMKDGPWNKPYFRCV